MGESRALRLREWFGLRGTQYVRRRAAILVARYGITPARAEGRVEGFVAMLSEEGCAPTFSTPGCIVGRYPRFFRRLQDSGAEIAVHGYYHVHLDAYPPEQAAEQLLKAARVFADHGIEVHGTRCPYLSCRDDLLRLLPKDLFGYSSNEAIWWDVVALEGDHDGTAVFDALQRFYRPAPASEVVCTPRMRSDMVEIPVSLPDDLQLHDGLHLSPEAMAEAWVEMLHRVHRRGELFVLQFHPELSWKGQHPFMAALREATSLRPPVWVARLQDIGEWWREKSGFEAAVSSRPTGLRIGFRCSERATILARGLSVADVGPEWHGAYRLVEGRWLDLPAAPRPLVGLSPASPRWVAPFLRDQGYILDTGATAPQCGTYLDDAILSELTSQVALVDHIEAATTPLVRYWRWPRGARSAMCVSGDLDALTLLDYAARLFVR